jgi:hypothetical protein
VSPTFDLDILERKIPVVSIGIRSSDYAALPTPVTVLNKLSRLFSLVI